MNTSENKGTGKTMAMIGYIVAFIVVAFIALMVWGLFAQKDGYGRQKVDMATVMTSDGVRAIGEYIVRVESFTENDKKILETTISLDDGDDWTSFVPEADILTRRFMVEVFKKNLSFDKDTFRFIFQLTPLDNKDAGPQKVMSLEFTAAEMKQLNLIDGSRKILNHAKNTVYLDKTLSEKMMISFCTDEDSADFIADYKPFCDAQLSQLGVQR